MDSAKPAGVERVRVAITHKVQTMGVGDESREDVVDYIMNQTNEAGRRGRKFGWEGATKHCREKYGMTEPIAV